VQASTAEMKTVTPKVEMMTAGADLLERFDNSQSSALPSCDTALILDRYSLALPVQEWGARFASDLGRNPFFGRICVAASISFVARMSDAKSGTDSYYPGFRCAHRGDLLAPDDGAAHQ